MSKDKLVIDIETKNTFNDVGGRDNVDKLEASLAVVYSYKDNDYLVFKEHEWGELAPVLQNAGLIIGFAINRFDLPVMKKYFNFNVMSLPKLDLLEEIEIAYGQRIGLDVLAKANLNIGKTGHGLDAINYYQNGDWPALIEYCKQDVKITKELYEHIKKNGYVLIPKKDSDEILKVPVLISEMETPATLF
jgi:DEAD/DEAH box helicase domain-containing protein